MAKSGIRNRLTGVREDGNQCLACFVNRKRESNQQHKILNDLKMTTDAWGWVYFSPIMCCGAYGVIYLALQAGAQGHCSLGSWDCT